MLVHIDPVKCEGFGPCADAAPELFELDEWGYAKVRGDGAVGEAQVPAAQKALEACPVQAISLREE